MHLCANCKLSINVSMSSAALRATASPAFSASAFFPLYFFVSFLNSYRRSRNVFTVST